MAHPRTQPMLSGWAPLQEPSRRLSVGELGRWLWPATLLAAFAAMTAYVAETSPGPGISTRGLVSLALAVIVLAVLTVRRRWGPLAVLRTLAEYAVVAALAGLLVLATAPTPAAQPTRERQTRTEQAATLPPVIRQVVGAWDRVAHAAGWVAELWRRAGDQADHRAPPPSTTRPNAEAMATSPRSPTSSSAPSAPSIWRFHA
jgi:hypothetical protein